MANGNFLRVIGGEIFSFPMIDFKIFGIEPLDINP